jgi:hypothetical protein
LHERVRAAEPLALADGAALRHEALDGDAGPEISSASEAIADWHSGLLFRRAQRIRWDRQARQDAIVALLRETMTGAS